MRPFAALALLALVACNPGEAQPQASAGALRIECAQGANGELGPDCLVEKVDGEAGPEFVVRHPGGAFRRFRIAQDRSGMVAIDGADEAVNVLAGDPPLLEVRVGPDRYRFPVDLDAKP